MRRHIPTHLKNLGSNDLTTVTGGMFNPRVIWNALSHTRELGERQGPYDRQQAAAAQQATAAAQAAAAHQFQSWASANPQITNPTFSQSLQNSHNAFRAQADAIQRSAFNPQMRPGR